MQDDLKNELRNKILTLLRNQKEEDRVSKSAIIRDKLFELPEFTKSKKIMFYASFDGEVDTFEMMKQAINLDKTVVLPITIKNDHKICPRQITNLSEDLTTGPFGIKQPSDECSKKIDLNALDMVIVPGVAFDSSKNRLGRGHGYYDRFLKELSPDVPTIGLAFDFQIVDHVPHHNGQDVPVTQLISN